MLRHRISPQSCDIKQLFAAIAEAPHLGHTAIARWKKRGHVR